MIDRRNMITSKELMVYIISAMVGVGVLSLPNRLSKEVGHDGWIPLILTGVISIIMAVIIIKLLERYGDKSIFEINMFLYGKYLGWCINIFYLSYLALKVSISLRIFTEVVKTIVLKATPLLVIASLLLVPTIYLSWYGLKPVCRFAYLIFPGMLAVMFLFVLNLKYVRPVFLMPVGESSMPSVFNAVRVTAYTFLAFAFPWVLYPMIQDKDKAMKSTIAGLIISTLFFVSVVVVVTGFFGENMLKHLVFPIYSLARSYRAPIIERIDLFFLIMWIPVIAMSLRAYFFVTYYWINTVFNIKKQTISLFLFTILIIYMSSLPSDTAEVTKFLELADMIGIPLVIGMAVVGYILSFINKKGVQKK